MAEEQVKTETGKKRFVFSWKLFWVYGVIWILMNGVLLGIWKTGAFAVREAARIRTLIEWQQRFRQFDPEPRRDRVRPFRQDKRRVRGIENWISKNLPKCGKEEQESAASAFRETAEMLRSGELTGVRDSFAELTARIQPEVDRETWFPFLDELSGRMLDELPDDPEPDEIAEIFDRTAESVGPNRRKEISDIFQAAVPHSSCGIPEETRKPGAESPETDSRPQPAPPSRCGRGTACSGGVCYGY